MLFLFQEVKKTTAVDCSKNTSHQLNAHTETGCSFVSETVHILVTNNQISTGGICHKQPHVFFFTDGDAQNSDKHNYY